MNGLTKDEALIAQSTVGGLASIAGGGKFGNGAVTAAFGYLFNELAVLCVRALDLMSILAGDLMHAARSTAARLFGSSTLSTRWGVDGTGSGGDHAPRFMARTIAA